MDNKVLRMTTAFLDTKGIKYQITGEKDNILEVKFNCENVESIKVLFFYADNTNCAFRAYDFCKFPESKKKRYINCAPL